MAVVVCWWLVFIYTGLVDDGQRDPPAERKLISRVALLGHVLTPILVLLHNPAQHSTTCLVHVIVGCNWTCDEVCIVVVGMIIIYGNLSIYFE